MSSTSTAAPIARGHAQELFDTGSSAHELAFVLTALRRVEDGGARDALSTRSLHRRRVQQHGQSTAVGTDELEGDLSHTALGLEHGPKMGLVVELAAAGQQRRQVPGHEGLPSMAGPAQQGLVHSNDGAVLEHRQIPAGRLLVQVFRSFLEHEVARPPLALR